MIVKNFGQSTAYIKRFEYDSDLSGCYKLSYQKDYLKDLENSVLAPGQSRICMLDYHKIPEEVEFDVEYRSDVGKIYNSHFNVDLKAGTSLPTAKMCARDKELQTISFTLQEMLQKSL